MGIKLYRTYDKKGNIMLNSIKRVTSLVQYVLSEKIEERNIVIDGTMGNGNDTIFLAKLVGSEGKVYAFDIQSIAIESTKNKINSNKLDEYNIKLINDSHENIDKYVLGPVDAAMFNLGYLPKGDHSIITKSSSTIKGILSTLKLLKCGGIISIIIYYGHDGGIEEKQEVLNFLQELSNEDVTVMQCDYINHSNNPPIAVFIEKNK